MLPLRLTDEIKNHLEIKGERIYVKAEQIFKQGIKTNDIETN